MTEGKLQQLKQETEFLSLREELENLAGHDPVLKHLLQQKDLPTVDDYISMQWMDGMPDEIDPEEEAVVVILRQLNDGLT